jgi:hypothetical protein
MQPRTIFRAAVLLASLALSGAAGAHHSYARFDRCHLFTIVGEIEHVRWGNPHVELTVHGMDGVTYSIIWLNLQQLTRAGIESSTLEVGDHVEVTGTKQPEDRPRIIAQLTQIWRPKDGWRWSQPPQGC